MLHLLAKHLVCKTNNWHTAYKCARIFARNTGLPVRIVKRPKGKRIVITDRILWENEGCPAYHLNMPPKTKYYRGLDTETVWW